VIPQRLGWQIKGEQGTSSLLHGKLLFCFSTLVDTSMSAPGTIATTLQHGFEAKNDLAGDFIAC
jgi:hypothetical protein